VTDACPQIPRDRLPNRRAHTLLNIEAGGFRYVAGVGHYRDGRLAEIFLTAAKGGTAIDDAARDSAVVASIALQHGVDAHTLRHALMRNGSGVASGPLGTLLDLLANARGDNAHTTGVVPDNIRTSDPARRLRTSSPT
jgi:hypothetical protein